MKSLIEKAFFLKKVCLFNELDLELLLAIAEKLHEDEYDAKEVVFSIGQVANRIYLIEKGTVEIVNEKFVPQAELGPHDYFGDESLFNDLPRSYRAVCKTDGILFTLSRSHLLSTLAECPSVALCFLQTYAKKLPCRVEESP